MIVVGVDGKLLGKDTRITKLRSLVTTLNPQQEA